MTSFINWYVIGFVLSILLMQQKSIKKVLCESIISLPLAMVLVSLFSWVSVVAILLAMLSVAINYIRIKYALWLVKKTLKKISKDKPEELKKEMQDIIDHIDNKI